LNVDANLSPPGSDAQPPTGSFDLPEGGKVVRKLPSHSTGFPPG